MEPTNVIANTARQPRFVSLIEKVNDKAIELIGNESKWKQECRFIARIISGNSYLESIIDSNPKSFQNAILDVCSLDITLDPAFSYAYLVPRKRSVCLDLSYKGLVYMAYQSHLIKSLITDIVYEEDTFDFNGKNGRPKHKYDPFKRAGNKIGVYCCATLCSGEYLTTVVTAKEIEKIRNCSDSWKGQKGAANSPWVQWEDDMWKKSCIKKAAKEWPISVLPEHNNFVRAVEKSNYSDGIEFEGTRIIDKKSTINNLLFSEGDE